MVERLGGPLVLPRFTGTPGEIAAFKGEIAIGGNRPVLEKGVVAHLPRVIGAVPPQERPFFDRAATIKGTSLRRETSADISFMEDPRHAQILRENLPVTFGLVQAYLDAMDLDLAIESCLVDTKTTRAGEVPLIKSWHLDKEIFFLINNNNGTEFTDGAFKLNTDNTIALLGNNLLAAAKPYEIVPISPLTIHRSPVFPKDALRTRMVLYTDE